MASRRDPNATYLSGEDFTPDMAETHRATYRDEKGAPKFQVRRKEDKKTGFKKCPVYHHENTNGYNDDSDCNWIAGIEKGTVDIPYNLPALLRQEKTETTYIAEGEPCVDALMDIGLVATCNMYGAHSGAFAKPLSRFYKGRTVAILADNDPAGIRHAHAIRVALSDVAARVVIIYFRDKPTGFDVKDLIEQEGKNRTLEIINEAVAKAIEIDAIVNANEVDKEDLIQAYMKKWKLAKRPVTNMVKAAKADILKGDVDAIHYYIESKDENGRFLLQRPSKDSRMTEELQQLDRLLMTEEPEPPMRGMGEIPYPVEVRYIETIGGSIHALVRLNDDGKQADDERVEPPKMHLLVRHNKSSMQLLIERYVSHYKLVKNEEGGMEQVPCAPLDEMIEAVINYRDSQWPKANLVQTTPLVLPHNGEMLCDNGLNKNFHIVFRIDEAIRKMMPKGRPTDKQIKAAIDRLFNKWLVDVSATNAGKYSALALCLSILERPLFPDRPVFWVTAGKRGGGKTTLLNMVSMAVLGTRAPATAWSENDEERRKALFSAARQGIPFLVFDNLPKHDVSCPHVEKFSTADTYTDRILKESTMETVSASLILSFTANNVNPRGDLASRSLMIRILVDRVDPENRDFVHDDPIGWTADNRAAILADLYTVLLGNPRFYSETELSQPKTRFKMWWHVVGAALEYAAMLCGDVLDFNKEFHQVEDDSDEGSSVAEVLHVLRHAFKSHSKGQFTSKDVKELMDRKAGDNYTSDAMAIRSWLLEDGVLNVNDITAQGIGFRLRKIVQAPVMYGEDKLTLESKIGGGTNSRVFWVNGPEIRM